jgi:hypothetical protein
LRLIKLASPAALVAALAIAAPASAGTTADFNFEHNMTNDVSMPATVPGMYAGGTTRTAGTYESENFTIAPGDSNGSFIVHIEWAASPADNDFDLYVYKLDSGGNPIFPAVASSASGGTTEENAQKVAGLDTPIEPGNYRIYVDNWASADPNWTGNVRFGPFVPGNRKPTAALGAPLTASAGKIVLLDATGSTDVDGTIVDYAWDLDGDGRFETDAGALPTVLHAFPAAGAAHIGLRVTDDRGAKSYDNKDILIAPAEASLAPPGVFALRASKQKLKTVRKKGLSASVDCPVKCSIALRLRDAKGKTLGRAKTTLASGGTAKLRVKLTKKAKKRLKGKKRATLRLHAEITPAPGTGYGKTVVFDKRLTAK